MAQQRLQNMQQSCIGCRTSFQQAEELGLENLTIQFKDYQIPLKDDVAKWNILKAILSFMNSKGGTIYIGVQDKKGRVKGLFLERKDRDNFKLVIKQLLQKITPKVDLNNREEVEIQYVPVFKDSQFLGKYAIKIIVQQGDPSQVYCISQRIRLEGGPNNKFDEFQIYYAYQRHNMGGAEQIKGVKLIKLIQQKAIKPYKIASTFHQNCNPPQPYLEVEIRTVIFSSISQQQHKILETVYKSYFQSENIYFQDKHIKQKMSTEIHIEDLQQFNLVKSFISDKLAFLNQIFQQSGCPVQFQIKGEVQHYFSIINSHGKKNGKAKKDKDIEKNVNKDQSKKERQFPYKQEQLIQQKQPQNRFTNKNGGPKVQQRREQVRFRDEVNRNKKEDEFVITFTHIEPRSIQTLEKFLRERIYRAYSKNFTRYKNTLQMSLQNQKQRQNYLTQLINKQKQLASYGFKQELRYGINAKQLKICNVNWQKGGELKTYLKGLMKDDLENFKHQKNAIVCQMKNRESACTWLDNLLTQREFKQIFSIKGAAQNKVPKIKVYLNVDKVVRSQ